MIRFPRWLRHTPVKLTPITYVTDDLELIRREKELLCSGVVPITSRTGLALSGGGIRSATFCLGALQALAGRGLLDKFDFLSSVSGGGYTASALQWWWSRPGSRYDAGTKFPYGIDGPQRPHSHDEPILRFLRRHGNYLAPGNGLTLASMAAVVLRTLLLNLLIWLPLIAALFLLLILGSDWVQDVAPTVVRHIPNPVSWAVASDWTSSKQAYDTDRPYLPMPLAFGVCLWAAIGLSTYLVYRTLVLAALSFVSRPDLLDGQGASLRTLTVIFTAFAAAIVCTVAVLLVVAPLTSSEGMDAFSLYSSASFALASASAIILVIILATTFYSYDKSNYFWRRSYEVCAGRALVAIGLLAALGCIPIIPNWITNKGGQLGGSVFAGLGALGGRASSIYGHIVQSRRSASGGWTETLATVGSAVFLYAFGVAAYAYAILVSHPGGVVAAGPQALDVVSGLAAGFMLLAFCLASITNLNHVGLHRFYRDRIMEAFMPEPKATEGDGSTTRASQIADDLLMRDLWPHHDEAGKPRRLPYPLINTNVVLVDDSSPTHRIRGGDNFVLSPLFVGSSATGWQDTRSFIEQNGALTLPSAMAASGAALNANSGYVGTGVTRARLVSIVLTLLNLKLGFWVARPSGQRHGYKFFTPNHFFPGLWYGVLRRGFNAGSRFAELSDGGHFDNLGLYELVRRRLALIVVIDAEADFATAMPALVSVVERVRQDFGASIFIPEDIDALVPVQQRRGFPIKANYANRSCFEADIAYAGDAPGKASGKLVYVKASFLKEVDFATKGYWAKDPTFPHQTTADQFFDPGQFEAYRQLGHLAMLQAIRHAALETCLSAT